MHCLHIFEILPWLWHYSPAHKSLFSLLETRNQAERQTNRVTAAPVSLVFCPATVSVFNDGVLIKSAEHQTAQRQSWQRTCEQNGAQEAALRFILRQHWLRRKLISCWSMICCIFMVTDKWHIWVKCLTNHDKCIVLNIQIIIPQFLFNYSSVFFNSILFQYFIFYFII